MSTEADQPTTTFVPQANTSITLEHFVQQVRRIIILDIADLACAVDPQATVAAAKSLNEALRELEACANWHQFKTSVAEQATPQHFQGWDHLRTLRDSPRNLGLSALAEVCHSSPDSLSRVFDLGHNDHSGPNRTVPEHSGIPVYIRRERCPMSSSFSESGNSTAGVPPICGTLAVFIWDIRSNVHFTVADLASVEDIQATWDAAEALDKALNKLSSSHTWRQFKHTLANEAKRDHFDIWSLGEALPGNRKIAALQSLETVCHSDFYSLGTLFELGKDEHGNPLDRLPDNLADTARVWVRGRWFPMPLANMDNGHQTPNTTASGGAKTSNEDHLVELPKIAALTLADTSVEDERPHDNTTL